MGQHLHLYASSKVSLPAAHMWCHWRAYELTEMPPDDEQRVFARVAQIMSERHKLGDFPTNPDHHESGPCCDAQVWGFLVWQAYRVTDELIDRVAEAGRTATTRNPHLRERYPTYDFATSGVIDFVRASRGRVLWGDNDGI